jgi:hypothetical protein
VGLPRRLAFCIAAVVVLGVSFPRTARAGASARLVYLRGPGAEQCPGEAAIRGAVSSRLGYDPFFAWAHDTLFTEIDRSGDAFRAVVKLVDANNMQRGARELSVRGSDCSAVIDVLALTISLTIDPSSVIGEPTDTSASAPRPTADAGAPSTSEPPSPPSQAAAAPEPAVPPPPRTSPLLPAAPNGRPEPHEQPEPRRRPSDPLSLRLALGALAAVLTAPAPNAGLTLSIGGTWRIFSFDLEGRADLPSQGSAQVPLMEVRSWLIAGSLVPCAHLGLLFGCPVASVGAIGATARGVARPRDNYAPWWALGGRVGAEWAPVSRVILRAYVEGLGTMLPVDLYVDGGKIYDFSRWNVDFGGAVAWRFL